MPITALYAGLLAPVLVILIFRVVGTRRVKSVEIGDGADRDLLRRMRVHANFIETAPYALILMGLAESLASPPLLLHVAGLSLLTGRVVHAMGLSREPHILAMRVAGMMLTVISIAVSAALCLFGSLSSGAGLLATLSKFAQ